MHCPGIYMQLRRICCPIGKTGRKALTMAETKVTVGRYINVEFTLRVPDLNETDGPYLLAEDLGDMISRAVHDLEPDAEQAQAIFANLKHKMNELLLFADNDYPEAKR